ncbi:transcriptional regulator MerD [Pseudomonas fluorescens]|uniref:HTH-type transcriptional regulator MerD n=1 Tax=Pseudomonas fluorescens TaxID=294 RepID=A0A379I826_PSEFL|nr:transcriptional regulator MerD [Pseudomonas fluorescens]
MSAYTVSRLALDAGVSVHIVRDYLLRGLLRPVACTPGGYGLFDDAALQRLCFVRAAFEAGVVFRRRLHQFTGLAAVCA